MNQIEEFQKIIDESRNIVFLAVREYRQRAVYQILEAVTVSISRITDIRRNKL